MPATDPHVFKFCQRVLGDITEDGSISHVDLIHTSPDGHDKIDGVDLGDEPEPEDLAQKLTDRAAEDAATREPGARQRYVLRAFRAGLREHEFSCAFVVHSQAIAYGGSLDSEPADHRGLIAQDKRHREDTHRMLVGMIDPLTRAMGQLNVMLEQSFKQQAKAQDQLLQASELIREVRMDESKMKLEEEKERLRMERMGELMQAVTGMAPMLIGRLMGKEAGSHGRDQAIGSLFQNLSEEEGRALMAAVATWSPEKQATLLQIYETYKKDAEAREAKAAGQKPPKPEAEPRPNGKH